MSMQITGNIILPPDIKSENGKIYIRVQDTSVMDAPAETIAELVLNYPSPKAAKKELPFKINVEAHIDPAVNYTLFVHIDLDLDKQLSKGDWMHNRAYPAVVRGEAVENLSVSLRRI